MIKRHFKCFNILASLLMLFMLQVNSVSARSIPATEGLEAFRRGFGTTTDFTADFTQEKQLSLMKKAISMKGRIRFKKPDLFMMEIDPPFAGRMLLKDTVIEQSAGKGEERTRIVLPPEQGLKHWFAKLATPVTTLPDGVKIRADLTNSLYTLTITPEGKGAVKEIVLAFQADGVIKRFVIYEQNGDRATMTLKKVRRNIGLTERDFLLD